MQQRVLTEGEIDHLLRVPKPVHDFGWHKKLFPLSVGLMERAGRFDLEPLNEGPIRGTQWIYARESLNPIHKNNFSAGLVFQTLQGDKYHLVRCDGPFHRHRNRIEKVTLDRTAHIHHLTERYQLDPKMNDDGFAETTSAFTTLTEAVSHLAGMINLVPDGILFLPMPDNHPKSAS